MNNSPKKIAVLIFLMCALIGFVSFFMVRSSQDNAKDTIRVLIDRYPNRQVVDATFKRILPLIEEFHYTIVDEKRDEFLLLAPPSSSQIPTPPKIEFRVVRDEVTRSLVFFKNDADVIYDSLAIAKTEWLRKKSSQVIAAPGLNLSYLAFNLRNQKLSDVRVRLAIAHALPIQDWISSKFLNWLEEPRHHPLSYNPARSKTLLDEAGYKPNAEGVRLKLRYFTTPVREGYELALMVAEALKQVGIQVELTTFETSLFFARLKNFDFDLFSSRWFRYSEQEPIRDLLITKGKRNFFGYSNPEFDRRLESETNLGLDEATSIIYRDLPFLPLFNWKHGLVISKRIQAPAGIETRLDESFRFLSELRLK